MDELVTKVYLDADGVLINLEKALQARGIGDPQSLRNNSAALHKVRTELTVAQKALDDEILGCFREPGFFLNAPMMDNAGELWTTANRPIVLTAQPRDMNSDDALRIGFEKRNSIEFYFGQLEDDRFIYCQRADKKKYARGNILVDDSKVNCAEWTENGGIAVWFSNMDQAIRDLRKLVGQ